MRPLKVRLFDVDSANLPDRYERNNPDTKQRLIISQTFKNSAILSNAIK